MNIPSHIEMWTMKKNKHSDSKGINGIHLIERVAYRRFGALDFLSLYL